MKKKSFRLFLFILITVILVFTTLPRGNPQTVVIVELKSRIDEGTYYLVKRGVESAKGGILILVIDSYGGYLDSMDKIINLLVSSDIKTISWIPPGGKAASAAAVIAMATDKLYMGKGSVIGSIKPYPDDPKTVEYMVARVSSLLSKKGVNDSRSIAERLVKGAESFTESEASALGITQGNANSIEELLSKENLQTAEKVYVSGDVVSDFLSIILDPAVAILLLLLGVLLIFLELKVTGFQGWGILGAAFIIIALYTFNVTGINITTFVLSILGIALVFLEFKKPGIQLAGVSGIALIIIALIFEYLSRPYPMFSPSITIVSIGLLLIVILLAFVITKALETLKMKTPTLQDKLMGKVGYAKTAIPRGGRGIVYVEGEDWTAESDTDVPQGSRVIVRGIENLILKVEPTGEQGKEPAKE